MFVVNFRIFEDFVKVLLLLLLLLEDICDDSLKDIGDGWMHGVWVDAWCVDGRWASKCVGGNDDG